MKELELDFIPKNKNVTELEDYAMRNKLQMVDILLIGLLGKPGER